MIRVLRLSYRHAKSKLSYWPCWPPIEVHYGITQMVEPTLTKILVFFVGVKLYNFLFVSLTPFYVSSDC